MYLFIDTGEHNGYFFLLGHLTKACQVVDTGRIDERNFTHADDAHFGAVAQPRHDFFEFGGDAEEVRTVYFIYFHILGDYQVLVIACNVRFCIRVYFIFDDGYFGSLHDAAHKQHAGNHQTYFNGNSQVEDDGQEESNQQYRDIRFRILQ